jgi:hypothetical protein
VLLLSTQQQKYPENELKQLTYLLMLSSIAPSPSATESEPSASSPGSQLHLLLYCKIWELSDSGIEMHAVVVTIFSYIKKTRRIVIVICFEEGFLFVCGFYSSIRNHHNK